MKNIVCSLVVMLCVATSFAKDRPNVVMIAVDDMCDWIEPLGSSMAKTPNLDRLAKQGAVFSNAHTAGVYCAPSRSAIFTGRYASTTGCYSNQVYFHNHPEYRPLQVAFKEGGYAVFGTGKLFHHPAGFLDQRGWDEFHVRNPLQRTSGWPMDSWDHDAPLPDPYPHSPYNQANPQWKGKPFMEVGPIPNDQEENMADTIRTEWVCDLIGQKHDKPFFIGLGLYAPHFPNYAPQKYFDLYPLGSIQSPPIKADDLDDIPEIVRKKHESRKRNIHGKLIEMDIIESTIQGYLACISYADAMVGRVLDAIERGPNRDNTVVIFWSDHGYAHGEKGHWGKHTLWQRTSQVPFIWAGPGVKEKVEIGYTATLLDIYPTLVEMCGLPGDEDLEGESLVSILKQGKATESDHRSVMLPYDEPNSYAIINEEWRYIQYRDGSEELYDVRKDPHEWNNLAADKEMEPIKKKLRALAPKAFAPQGMTSSELKIVTDGESFKWIPKTR
jgi:arylsulfatase A-like enzyme